eukprot:g896.t1
MHNVDQLLRLTGKEISSFSFDNEEEVKKKPKNAKRTKSLISKNKGNGTKKSRSVQENARKQLVAHAIDSSMKAAKISKKASATDTISPLSDLILYQAEESMKLISGAKLNDADNNDKTEEKSRKSKKAYLSRLPSFESLTTAALQESKWISTPHDMLEKEEIKYAITIAKDIKFRSEIMRGVFDDPMEELTKTFGKLKKELEEAIVDIFDRERFRLVHARAELWKKQLETVDLHRFVEIVRRVNGGQFTALQHATYYEKNDVVKLLLDMGANPNIPLYINGDTQQLLSQTIEEVELENIDNSAFAALLSPKSNKASSEVLQGNMSLYPLDFSQIPPTARLAVTYSGPLAIAILDRLRKYVKRKLYCEMYEALPRLLGRERQSRSQADGLEELTESLWAMLMARTDEDGNRDGITTLASKAIETECKRRLIQEAKAMQFYNSEEKSLQAEIYTRIIAKDPSFDFTKFSRTSSRDAIHTAAAHTESQTVHWLLQSGVYCDGELSKVINICNEVLDEMKLAKVRELRKTGNRKSMKRTIKAYEKQVLDMLKCIFAQFLHRRSLLLQNLETGDIPMAEAILKARIVDNVNKEIRFPLCPDLQHLQKRTRTLGETYSAIMAITRTLTQSGHGLGKYMPDLCETVRRVWEWSRLTLLIRSKKATKTLERGHNRRVSAAHHRRNNWRRAGARLLHSKHGVMKLEDNFGVSNLNFDADGSDFTESSASEDSSDDVMLMAQQLEEMKLWKERELALAQKGYLTMKRMRTMTFSSAFVLCSQLGHHTIPPLLEKYLEKIGIACSDVLNEPNEVGRTPLMYAAARGETTIVQQYIAMGASLDVQDAQEGWTALHHAARQLQANCITLLIEAGATIMRRAHAGQLPMHLVYMPPVLLGRSADELALSRSFIRGSVDFFSMPEKQPEWKQRIDGPGVHELKVAAQKLIAVLWRSHMDQQMDDLINRKERSFQALVPDDDADKLLRLEDKQGRVPYDPAHWFDPLSVGSGQWPKMLAYVLVPTYATHVPGFHYEQDTDVVDEELSKASSNDGRVKLFCRRCCLQMGRTYHNFVTLVKEITGLKQQKERSELLAVRTMCVLEAPEFFGDKERQFVINDFWKVICRAKTRVNLLFFFLFLVYLHIAVFEAFMHSVDDQAGFIENMESKFWQA